MKRKKVFIGRAVLVLISVGIALLFAEAALRYFRPSYTVGIPWSYQYEAERGYILGPGVHLFRTTDFQQESRVNGIGTSNFQETFAGYERLVFAVGDSYTEGIGVAADMSYPFQLDLTLNRDDQGLYIKRYGVANLGVGGYGGEQSLRNLRAWAMKLGPPSIILYMGCDNDFNDDLMFGAGYRHGVITRGSPLWGTVGAPLRWLAHETQLGVKVNRRLKERKQEQLRAENISRMGLGDKYPSTAELEAENLERLAAAAREYGSFLVVTWSDEGASYDWLKRWAADKGLAFADWAARTNSVRAAMPALPLDNTHSGGHHRGWTNRLIAEEFARQIQATQK